MAQNELNKHQEALNSLNIIKGKTSEMATQIDELEQQIKEEALVWSIVDEKHPDRVKMGEFEQYMRQQNAIINKCKIKWKDESHRFLVATADILKDEDVVAVPYQEWLTLEKIALDSPLIEKLNNNSDLASQLSEPWRNKVFGIFFAEQLKDQNTKYRSYLNSLPYTVSNYPELFGQEDLSELEGSDLMLQRINNKNDLVRKDYNALCLAEPVLKDLNLRIEAG